MIGNATNIIIAVAAVIGLVPLGIRAVHDMIKTHRRKKNNDMWMTVIVSALAANIGPPVLKDLAERMGASIEQLPPWAKALITVTQAPPGTPTAVPPPPPQTPQADLQSHVSQAEHGSANGSSTAPAS